MPATFDPLPIAATLAPQSQEELAEAVRACYAEDTAIYPIGGGTSLDYGLAGERPGAALSLAGLDRVVDYPARDMTITVEAGATVQSVNELLASERQRLEFDVPHADRATVGGVVATNFNGPRRFAHGAVRDQVIGVTAVDGTGLVFHGGGRVVKNVAGYDFCKLLTGSLGTLAVITQLTFKVRPLPEAAAHLACRLESLAQAERLLAALVTTQTAPAAIELLGGPAWQSEPFAQALGAPAETSEAGAWLVVGFEGSGAEVRWQLDRLAAEWRDQNIPRSEAITGESAEALWRRLAGFAAQPAPLSIKASVVPSGVTPFVDSLLGLDAAASWQSHAGNGVVVAHLSEAPKGGLGRAIVQTLQPAAARHQGNLVALATSAGAEATRRAVWGRDETPLWLMADVKRQFDPKNLLNPGRFVV